MLFDLSKALRSLLVAMTLFLCAQTNGLNIILDLGNVVIQTDSITALRLTGHSAFFWYAGYNPGKLLHLSQEIRHRLYTFMEKVKPYNRDEVSTYDEHNNRLPQLMCDWLKGTLTNQEVKHLLHAQAIDHPAFFSSSVEQNLLIALVTFMFTPSLVTQALYLDPNAQLFVKACKRNNHKIYILSNFETESFALLAKKQASFFDLCDGIVISGAVHTIKPSPDIYEYLFRTYHLKPDECIFIDDRIENREQAHGFGMSCFFKQKRSYTTPWKKVTDFDAAHAFIQQCTRG